MNPHVASQIHSIIEDLRLMESFVTAPLGLVSDIRMLRQSMPLPEAADLPLDRERQRRLSDHSLTDDPPRMVLSALERMSTSLASLDLAREGTGSPLGAEWMARARRVLSRAESRVAGDLRAGTAAGIKGLYVIVDPEATGGRPAAEVALAALRGGASVIQLRDKTHDGREVLRTARDIRSMCVDHGTLFVMNDDPSIALSSGAHGLHLGQADLPVPEARRVLRPEQLLGLSNNSLEEVARSQAAGADYLAVGAVFSTKTHGQERQARPGNGDFGEGQDPCFPACRGHRGHQPQEYRPGRARRRGLRLRCQRRDAGRQSAGGGEQARGSYPKRKISFRRLASPS